MVQFMDIQMLFSVDGIICAPKQVYRKVRTLIRQPLEILQNVLEFDAVAFS